MSTYYVRANKPGFSQYTDSRMEDYLGDTYKLFLKINVIMTKGGGG